MANRFTESAQNALNAAPQVASRLGHTYIGSEHILLGILYNENSVASKLLISKGITYEKLFDKIAENSGAGDAGSTVEFELTPRTKHIIEMSGDLARATGQSFIATEHILMALLRENECIAVRLLKSEGVNIPELYNEAYESIGGGELGMDEGAFSAGSETKKTASSPSKTSTPTLDKYKKRA